MTHRYISLATGIEVGHQNPEKVRRNREILSAYYKDHGVAIGESPSDALIEAAHAHAFELQKNDLPNNLTFAFHYQRVAGHGLTLQETIQSAKSCNGVVVLCGNVTNYDADIQLLRESGVQFRDETVLS